MLGYVTDPSVDGGLVRRDLPEPRPGEHDVVLEVAAYAAAAAPGGWRPQLGVVRDWSETVEAVEALRTRQAAGKAVLTR